MEETTQTNAVYIVKVSGPDTAFIDDIVSTLKNAYLVLYVSKLKANSEGGYHLFVDIIRSCEP